jgi:hypothetical protein
LASCCWSASHASKCSASSGAPNISSNWYWRVLPWRGLCLRRHQPSVASLRTDGMVDGVESAGHHSLWWAVAAVEEREKWVCFVQLKLTVERVGSELKNIHQNFLWMWFWVGYLYPLDRNHPTLESCGSRHGRNGVGIFSRTLPELAWSTVNCGA